MSGAREDRRATMAAALRSRTEPAAAPPATRPLRAKDVRVVTDLTPERHRWLRNYALEHGAKVTDILRELVDELERSPDLAGRIGPAALAAAAERRSSR